MNIHKLFTARYLSRTMMVSKPLPLFVALALAAGTLGMAAGLASAQQKSWTPYTGVSEGAMLPYPKLKAIADRAAGGGRLIGSDFDKESWTYQMRYVRGTEIVDIVVDARTGRILGRRESM
ncbi:PepSY domain-containing protein [Sphingosinicellaceae bacterium]|nr:PepSY domain-containing protein [Sphingosinicellaceae bacterium]